MRQFVTGFIKTAMPLRARIRPARVGQWPGAQQRPKQPRQPQGAQQPQQPQQPYAPVDNSPMSQLGANFANESAGTAGFGNMRQNDYAAHRMVMNPSHAFEYAKANNPKAIPWSTRFLNSGFGNIATMGLTYGVLPNLLERMGVNPTLSFMGSMAANQGIQGWGQRRAANFGQQMIQGIRPNAQQPTQRQQAPPQQQQAPNP